MNKTEEISLASILLGMDASAAIALTGIAAYTAAALAVVTIIFVAKRLGELSE
jgi:hypothetical protein